MRSASKNTRDHKIDDERRKRIGDSRVIIDMNVVIMHINSVLYGE